MFVRRIARRFSIIKPKTSGPALRLTPEEEAHLKIPPEIANLSLFPSSCIYQSASFLPRVVDSIKWTFVRRHQSVARFVGLTKDRLDQIELMERFGLDSDKFNHKLYWLTIHSWILHQRFIVDKLNKLESDYVDRIWLLPYKWMMDKGVPRHRLQVELEHAHRHSLKFCVDMDQAISRPDILPGQMCEVLWKSIYSENDNVRSATDPKVVKLTKYIIRNLNFVLNTVPVDHFKQGAFAWPIDYQ